MSRGEDVRVGSRQNATRYLQISESVRVNKSARKKGFGERKTQSQKFLASNGAGGTKQLSLQDFVKNSPSYRPGIDQISYSKTEDEIGNQSKQNILSFAPKLTRSRIAEVFALSSYQAMSATTKKRKEKKGWAESVGVDGGAGHQHRSTPEIAVREPDSADLYRVGASANVDLVHAAVLNFKSLRKSDRRSPETFDQDEMTSNRGQNVSILHVRGPAEPWESPITTFADVAGSIRNGPKINLFRTGLSSGNFPVDEPKEIKVSGTLPGNHRKRDSGSSNSVSLFIGSGVSSSGNLSGSNRELSPVRWCDREVDGVYLGRSGWVQVQQRSLDESRRTIAKNSKPIPVASTLPNRVKLSHYHCNSEPGDHPDVRKDRPRPDYLPLPIEGNRNQEVQKTSSSLLQELDSLSPPSITPIISPPPAFQDPGSEANFKIAHVPRNLSGKPPFLSRSKAVVCDSPPKSPPSNWHSRSSSLQRFKRLTPSPASSQHHVLLNTQAKSLEDNTTTGTRRNQFQRFNESSTSSSSSSFGFRSLDGSIGRSSAMPRLNETDSSVEGYDDGDGDEEYRRTRGRMRSPPPEGYTNGERLSPNSFRQRNSHRSHAGRRTPSSEMNGKKYTKRSSSSSESCSSCERKSPNANFRRFNQRPSRGDGQSYSWDVRNSKVRRSRSLQLPEKRSPGVTGVATPSSSGGSREQLSPEYQFYTNYKNGGTSNTNNSGQYRVVVKVNGEAVNMSERPRRTTPKKAQSEDAKYEEMRREAEEETRIITEYLNSTRSRAAARDLLMHRYLNRPEEENRSSPVSAEITGDPLYNVYFPGTRRTSQKKALPQRSPATQAYANCSPPNLNPCSPSSCDFWPHCAHREVISYGKPSTPSMTSPPNMKSSQSYPSAGNHNSRKPEKPRKDEKQQKENRSSSTRSSPGSVDSANDFDPRKESRKGTGSMKSSPDTWRDKRQRQVGEKTRSKFENVDIDGHVNVTRKDDGNRKYLVGRDGPSSSSSSSEIYAGGTHRTGKNAKKSSSASTPMEEYESASSKSSMRDQKSEGTFSPRPGSAPADETEENQEDMDSQRKSLSLPKSFLSNGSKHSKQRWTKMHTHSENISEPNGNVRLRNKNMLKSVLESKVRKTCHQDGGKSTKMDAVRHSWHAVSLSDVHAMAESNLTWDCVQTNSMEDGLETLMEKSEEKEKPRRYRFRPGANGLFPWRKQFTGGSNSNSSLRPLTPEVSKTAPATPVREAGNLNKDKESVKQSQYVRSSSTPLLDEPPVVNSEWGARRDISQGTEESTKEIRINQKELLGQRNTLGNQSSESVLQKFKKSFSLRFHKSQKGGIEDVDDAIEDEEEPPLAVDQNETIVQPGRDDGIYDQKFRFGPLVWRSSKERKKGKKAVRNAKCNSGDSGIQIENSLHQPGDSSESHDTDQHDELDSPPMIRRRTASGDKSSRPQSEVINQILIDKFKADLQWRAQTKGMPNRRVRRTNSDLGGQRLFNWELRNSYRRMLSTSSHVRGRPSRLNTMKGSPEGPEAFRNKRPGRAQLRRSMSQPLGLNELSPLMRRKPSVGRNQILSEDEHDGRGATSDDEALSDSESSVTSLNDRKKSFEATMDEEVVILAEAVWDHVAMEPEELGFRAGDVIEVLDTLDRDWWWGATGDNYGWFPSAFVRLRVSQEDTVEDCLEAMASGAESVKQLRRRTSISLLSNDQVRSSVVRELLNTERDFVKVLRDVTEGYLAECRRRTDMFTPIQIETIFSNLEDLLAFQSQFLEDLEVRVDREVPHRSCVGEIFLKHRAGFRMYSEYCNSHPMAIATLQELYQRNNYSKFFEACRLMRGLIEIPLDGYLLTPIQRICKYPLQLAELLKYTKPDHSDHHNVKEALETMRGVAVLINERKRRMESLEKLAAWQQRVEGWEGEDLIEASTQLIYQGEAVRVTSGMWTTNITLFLFDHQLVYCKKDLLKRNTYVYKGRICMDTSEVIDISDGKDPQSGVTIRHGLKIYSCLRDKWLLFCCRNSEEKSKWLDAFAQERKLVSQDKQNGLELPAAARQLARMAAKSKRRPPNEPRSKTYKRDSHYNGYKVGRKVGTWFTFGAAKKSSRMNLRQRNTLQQVT